MLQHLDTIIAFTVLMLGLSLLVTVLTQMVTNVLALRGVNLKRGLVDLLNTVHPQLAQHAEAIAQRVLEHPLISDSTFARLNGNHAVPSAWRLATAVRIEEVLGILDRLSANTAAPAASDLAGCTPVEAMAFIVAEAKRDPSPNVQAMTAQVQKLAGALPQAPPANITVQLDKIMQQIPATAEANLKGLKSWFDAAMDRTAQRFTLHARIVTVILSILFVLGAHLDALRILKQLSSDADLRAKLVGISDAMQKHAETILGPQAQAPAPRPAPQTPSSPSPTGDAETHQKRALDELKKQAEAIKSDLSKTGFQVIPDPYPGLWNFSGDNMWGILAAAALLSLGAPFWFNMLRTLSNLRPLLASKQEGEQKQKGA